MLEGVQKCARGYRGGVQKCARGYRDVLDGTRVWEGH